MHVTSLNLQVSSKTKVTIDKNQASQVESWLLLKQVKSLLRSNKSQEVCMNVFFISVDTVNRRGWLVWRYICLKSRASGNTSAQAQISLLRKLFRVTRSDFSCRVHKFDLHAHIQ